MTQEKKEMLEPVETKTVMFTASNGQPFWAIPTTKGWHMMTPVGAQLLTMEIPEEIIQQLSKIEIKREE